MQLWNYYLKNLSPLESTKTITLTKLPDHTSNNAHVFYILCKSEAERKRLIEFLRINNIQAVFHYQALHRSKFFRKVHKEAKLRNAEKYTAVLLRLPLYYNLSLKEVKYVCDKIKEFYKA